MMKYAARKGVGDIIVVEILKSIDTVQRTNVKCLRKFPLTVSRKVFALVPR